MQIKINLPNDKVGIEFHRWLTEKIEEAQEDDSNVCAQLFFNVSHKMYVPACNKPLHLGIAMPNVRKDDDTLVEMNAHWDMSKESK